MTGGPELQRAIGTIEDELKERIAFFKSKGKLLEAMQCGTPSVTTTVGAESMQGSLAWNGIIADGAEAIANAAVKLYQDEALWKKAQQNGIAIVNERYQKSLFETDFVGHFSKVQAHLKQHRFNNFFGFLHHCC